MFKIIKIKKIKSVIRAVDDIWKYIIRPAKPIVVGDLLRLCSYNNYLMLQSMLSRSTPFDFVVLFDKETKILSSLDEKNLNTFQPLLLKVFKNNIDPVTKINNAKYDVVLLWGIKLYRYEKIIEYAIKFNNIWVLYVEDGFFRSVCGSIKNVDNYFSISHSLIFDDLAPHYDGNFKSRLDCLLQDDDISYLTFSEKANKLLSLITENYISKYNDQYVSYYPLLGSNKRKVLVVLQSEGDSSVTISGGSNDVFCRIIEDAIKENQDSDIIVKIHPDSLIKNNFNLIKKYVTDKRVITISFSLNLSTIIKYVDKVYTYSSQAGFEALLYKKKVYTYGTPFYSSYGLTVDRGYGLKKKNISFEKLFYDLNYRYTHYFNPETGDKVDPQDAIKEIINRRNVYFDNNRKKVLIIKLDGIGDWEIFRRYLWDLKNSKKFSNSTFDLLGDDGFKEYETYCNNKDQFFTKEYWISFRKNRLLKYLLKINNKRVLYIILIKFLYNKFFKLKYKDLLMSDYDAIIISCWNINIHLFTNFIMRFFLSKEKFIPCLVGDSKLSIIQNKIYNRIIPIFDDKNFYHRDTLERYLLSNVGEIPIPEKRYPKKKFNQNILIFTGAFSPTRIWPIENYRKLIIDLLHDFENVVFHVVGINKRDLNLNNNRVLCYGKNLKIKSLMNIIDRCSVYIGHDTGFYHVSVTNGLNCIVLSNGNSYNSFLDYKYESDMFIFEDVVAKIIENKGDDFLKLRRKSSFFVKDIPYNKVYKLIKHYLSSL